MLAIFPRLCDSRRLEAFLRPDAGEHPALPLEGWPDRILNPEVLGKTR